jgi:hypothetical protein
MRNIKLAEFFKNRKEQEEQLQKDLQTKAKQIDYLIPKEARGYTNEAMFHIDKWLLSLYTNTLAGSCNSDKIKELMDYGFTTQKDAKFRLALLKKAWKDEIEVKIIKESYYIKVEFRLIGVAK